MTRMPVNPLLVAATAVSTLLVGCQQSSPIARMEAAMPAPATPVLVEQARAALEKGDAAAAISFAELAVRATPEDADSRLLLGQAYLTSGRFASAAQSYGDVVAMQPDNDNARFRQAVALLGRGERDEALTQLDSINPEGAVLSDVGLAYALAGETERGVALLTKAVGDATANARTRQNLALALALSGEWAQARATAAQDLTPAEVDVRVAEWSRLAESGNTAWRTAMVLAVAPQANDAGRPVALAYVPGEDSAVQLARTAQPGPAAATEPVAVAASVETPQPPALLEKAELPVKRAASVVATVAAPAAPPPALLAAASTPKREAQLSKRGNAHPAFATLKPASLSQFHAATPGSWVVQLGAYSRVDLLQANWTAMRMQSGLLGDYEPLRSEIVLGSRKLHRLAVGEFDSRREAVDLCSNLRSQRRDCFVRFVGPASPVRVAGSKAAASRA